MRNRQKWIFMAVTALLMLLGMTTSASARNYSIDQYDVLVEVLPNGDADLTQHIAYDFTGKYNGVTYHQDIAGIKGADDPEVTAYTADGTKKLPISNSGANNTVSVTRIANAMNMKVFHKAEDETLTYSYKYRLHGVVKNYADAARLNWKIIGSGWDVPLSDVTVYVQLPGDDPINDLQAWTHGPLSGKTKVDRKNGLVKMTVSDLPDHQFLESDMLFPTSVTPDNPNVSDKRIIPSVHRQERELVEEANAKRRRSFVIKLVSIGILAVLALAAIIGTIVYLKLQPAKSYPQPTPIDHWYEVPTVSPAAAESILSKKEASSKGLTGEMLVAVNNHELKIEAKGKTFILTKLKDLSNKMLNFLIEKVGDGQQVSMDAVKKFAKKDKRARLARQFATWQGNVRKQKRAYFNKRNKDLREWLIAVGGLVSGLAGVIVIISLSLPDDLKHGIWIGAGALVVIAWIYALWQRSRISIYTEKGAIMMNELRGFRRMLKDVGHFNTATVGDLILWEQILPYAAAFGLADKVADALKTDFGEEAVNGATMSSSIYYYYYMPGLTSSFDSGFQSAFSSALSSSASHYSSVSGGSGGFSGGSSGGFGGGSGGGAF